MRDLLFASVSGIFLIFGIDLLIYAQTGEWGSTWWGLLGALCFGIGLGINSAWSRRAS